MDKEMKLSFKMTDEELEKIRKILSFGGIRHYILKISENEELDVIEYKEYQKLEQKNQKQKEVIEKAINFINNNGEKQYNHHDNYRGKWYSPDELNTLEDILKEVD